MSSLQTRTFHITGMHCNACILLTESDLQDVPFVQKAKSSLERNTVEVTGDFGDKTPQEIAIELTKVLAKNGYALHVEKPSPKKRWDEFAYAVPFAAAFVLAFIALQKTGMVSLIGNGGVTYGTAFIVGIVASLSTCMAVVGGLLLSLSATYAKHGDSARPHLLFHVGRLASFFVLGGAVGAAGSVFRLSSSATFLLSVVLGVVMLVMGFNLLDVFDWTKRLLPSMPKALSSRAFAVSKLNHSVTPFLVGIATFFLPCGFTQSMQLYALTTGSFTKGALTMGMFALGTLPVLALLSFGSFSVTSSPKRGIFFKTVGIVVILFALFNIANGLVAAGYLPPFYSL